MWSVLRFLIPTIKSNMAVRFHKNSEDRILRPGKYNLGNKQDDKDKYGMLPWWLRIGLPMQETWVWSLVGEEDPTCCGVTKPCIETTEPVLSSLGTEASEPTSCCWSVHNPLQFSCLENSMDRGAWQAIVHGITKRHDWVTNTTTIV